MRIRQAGLQSTHGVLVALIALTAAPCSWADPINVFDEFFFREDRVFQNGVSSKLTTLTPDAIATGMDQTIVLGAEVAATGTGLAPAGVTTMVATLSGTGEMFDVPAAFQSIFPLEYNLRIPYTDARAAGGLILDVRNEGTTVNTGSVSRAPVGIDPVPPFAADVEVFRRNDEMVVSWALPDGVGNAAQIRPRLHAPDGEIVLQEPLPILPPAPAPLGWSFPVIFAGEPGKYGIRVQVEELLALEPFVRRASTWYLFDGAESVNNGEFSDDLNGWGSSGNGTAAVVEFPVGSGGSMLNLTIDDPNTNEPVVLSQLIDTPPIVPSTGIPGFVVRFEHLFLTETGFLELLLNDILLETVLATDSFGATDPVQQSVLVTDLTLANLTDALLEFRLYPGSDASVLLDKVSLTPETAVPEPTTLLLMGLGLAGLGFARRRLR